MPAMQIQASHQFLRMSLEAWVTQLVEEFPGFDEYDIIELIEERTGLPVVQNAFDRVRALYLRSKLSAWEPEVDQDDR